MVPLPAAGPEPARRPGGRERAETSGEAMVGVRVVMAVVLLALAGCSSDSPPEPVANPPLEVPPIGPAVTAAPTMPVQAEPALIPPLAPPARDAAVVGEAAEAPGTAERAPAPTLPPVAAIPRLAALPAPLSAPETATLPPSPSQSLVPPPVELVPPPASAEAAATAAAAAELRARALQAFDGRWRPVMQLSGNDERCSRLLSVATFGPFTIEGGAVTGTIAVPRSGNYAVSGSVGGDGALVDVRAVGARSTITFHGRLTGNSGTGEWAGSRCSGSWTMSRIS